VTNGFQKVIKKAKTQIIICLRFVYFSLY
jgi:hypothetical protein